MEFNSGFKGLIRLLSL